MGSTLWSMTAQPPASLRNQPAFGSPASDGLGSTSIDHSVGGGFKWSSQQGDTVGEITTRRQKPLVLRIMVEQGRTMILFLSGLTPRCEQIFPHRCCFQPVRRIRQRCPVVFWTTGARTLNGGYAPRC